MASETHQHDDEGASLNLLGKAVLQVAQYGQNASNNLQKTFNDMTLQNWIRLTVIVGGYMLLRPIALKFISKSAVKNLEEQDAKEKEEAAKMTPNDLRGVRETLQEQEEEDDGDSGAAAWGQQARVRQRKVVKQLLEAEEKRRLEEDDEDKDIQEFLTE
jgi:hypothetical protein